MFMYSRAKHIKPIHIYYMSLRCENKFKLNK